MENSLISNVLKFLMFKKNVNTSKLARNINLPQQTLQRIVSGTSTNPHGKTLKAIADFFNISLEQLKGESPLPESILGMQLSTIIKAKTKEIPKISWNEAETYVHKFEEYPANEHVSVDLSVPDKTFAVTLPDSSMEPYFPKGSLLILDPEKIIKDRCFVLVKVLEGKTIIFRQLIIDGEHKYLKPLNPDLNTFPMRLLKESDCTLGVMIEFRYKFDNLQEENHEKKTKVN